MTSAHARPPEFSEFSDDAWDWLDGKCGACRFFDSDGGECRRYAPRPRPSVEVEQGFRILKGFDEAEPDPNEPHYHKDMWRQFLWPEVSADDFCGEFSRIPKVPENMS